SCLRIMHDAALPCRHPRLLFFLAGASTLISEHMPGHPVASGSSLPARFFGLTYGAAIIVAALSTPAACVASAASGAESAYALRLRARFIHGQGASFELLAVERPNGLQCFFVVAHLHESESARLTRVPVGHDPYLSPF